MSAQARDVRLFVVRDSRQVYTEVFKIIFAFHSVVSNSSVTLVGLDVMKMAS